MRAPISVVIPTFNAADRLPFCLRALAEGLDAGLIRDLILSDGGSTDDTLVVAEAAGAQVVTGPASRGGQLRRGAQRAAGDWLLVLHPQTVLRAGWAPAVADVLDSDCAWYFRLAFDRAGLGPRTVAGWANLRARVAGLPAGDQGLLIPRALYESVGGYRDIPLMEDMALARVLRGRLRGLGAVAQTPAAPYLAQGWARREGRNLWMLARYLAGADLHDLARARPPRQSTRPPR